METRFVSSSDTPYVVTRSDICTLFVLPCPDAVPGDAFSIGRPPSVESLSLHRFFQVPASFYRIMPADEEPFPFPFLHGGREAAFQPPLPADFFGAVPNPDHHARQEGRADRGGFPDGETEHLTAEDVHLKLHKEMLAEAPPSTRRERRDMPVSAVSASVRSRHW